MSSARIVYTQRGDVVSEGELNALADVYRIVFFEGNVSKEAAHPGGPDEAKERFKNDSRAKSIIPK
jgi:hypothetical protein